MEWFIVLASALCMIAVLAISFRLWLCEGMTTGYLEAKAQEFRHNNEQVRSYIALVHTEH